MDRPTNRADADARSPRLGCPESFVLPSRRPALDRCRGSIAGGPVLLTGDAGAGKTWLWRRLRAGSPASCRWFSVDLTPTDEPADFYRLLGHELGLVGPLEASRIGLSDVLTDRQANGESPVLVVEEAQNLSATIWEEVRILANRLGEPGGFSGLIFVGQTPLARRFSTRAFAAIAARLASRVHLGPIDADEARDLLIQHDPDRSWTVEEVESLHRDAAGNPGRMLLTLGPARSVVPPVTARIAPAPAPPLAAPLWSPLVLEDHVIEVGWSPDESIPDSDPAEGPNGLAANLEQGEEEVRDHYAALQAWREWSENQARRGVDVPGPVVELPEDPIDADEEEEIDEPTSPMADRPKLWADSEQSFAPYGQLFSRLSQAREAE